MEKVKTYRFLFYNRRRVPKLRLRVVVLSSLRARCPAALLAAHLLKSLSMMSGMVSTLLPVLPRFLPLRLALTLPPFVYASRYPAV